MKKRCGICAVMLALALTLSSCGSMALSIRPPTQQGTAAQPELTIRLELQLPEGLRKPARKTFPPLPPAAEYARKTKRERPENALPLPALTPCFQVDAFGCARPNDTLTRAEARRALNKLLADSPAETRSAARKALAQSQENNVRPAEWADALAAIYGSAGDIPDTETISRLDAASMIAAHYTLDQPENRDNYYLDLAITEETLGFSYLLEPGTLQQEAVMQQSRDGYFLNRGYLFKVDERGYSIPDVQDGVLCFDASGRYRSGDEELDRMVAETLCQLDAGGQDRFDLLRAAYLYCRDSNRYVGYQNHDYSYQEPNGPDGWSLPVAKTMLTEHKGNCYCFAAEFTYLARGLGYQAYTRGGFISGYTAHSWCELVEGDAVYICDPELEWNRHSHGEWARDFFYRSYEELAAWRYNSAV